MLKVISFYAAILTIIYLYLTLQVVKMRWKERIAVGVGNSEALLRVVSVHNNFSQYTPFFLLLLLIAAFNQMSIVLLNILGASFTIGRIIHLVGVRQLKEKLLWRQIGMVLSLGSLLTAAIYLLWRVFS